MAASLLCASCTAFENGADRRDAGLDAALLDAALLDAPATDEGTGSDAAMCAMPPALSATRGASCADIHELVPGTSDGLYVIDRDGAGGDPPFEVYCHDMAGTPREYLQLDDDPPTNPATGSGANCTVFYAGGACPCRNSLARCFWRVRIDIVSPTITILTEESTFAYEFLPDDYDCWMASPACSNAELLNFGLAGSCVGRGDMSGKANIDMRRTPFRADSTGFVATGTLASGRVLDTQECWPDVIDVLGGGGDGTSCGYFGAPLTSSAPGSPGPIPLHFR